MELLDTISTHFMHSQSRKGLKKVATVYVVSEKKTIISDTKQLHDKLDQLERQREMEVSNLKQIIQSLSNNLTEESSITVQDENQDL